MEWGDLSISFSLHPMHVSNFHLSFPSPQHFFRFIRLFFFFFFPSFGGQFAVTAVQTGGPKPLRYSSSLFTFLSPCSPSLRSLSLSVFPGCLARRTVLDLLVLSALCIWTLLCARLGLRPEVRASARISVFCQSA